MAKFLIGLLTSTQLSLLAIDEVQLRSIMPMAVIRQQQPNREVASQRSRELAMNAPNMTVNPLLTDFDPARFQAGSPGYQRMSSQGANTVLRALFAQSALRVACIVRASLDSDGNPLSDIEAAGYLGGVSSTIMVHNGTDHPDWSSGRRYKGPHIHLWNPPNGAVAWVHTHHPRRGLAPSINDIQAAAKMLPELGANLPFFVATQFSVTAYWHGFTGRNVAIAGRGWMDGLDISRCPAPLTQT